jgi:hypothetical protein
MCHLPGSSKIFHFSHTFIHIKKFIFIFSTFSLRKRSYCPFVRPAQLLVLRHNRSWQIGMIYGLIECLWSKKLNLRWNYFLRIKLGLVSRGSKCGAYRLYSINVSECVCVWSCFCISQHYEIIVIGIDKMGRVGHNFRRQSISTGKCAWVPYCVKV